MQGVSNAVLIVLFVLTPVPGYLGLASSWVRMADVRVVIREVKPLPVSQFMAGSVESLPLIVLARCGRRERRLGPGEPLPDPDGERRLQHVAAAVLRPGGRADALYATPFLFLDLIGPEAALFAWAAAAALTFLGQLVTHRLTIAA